MMLKATLTINGKAITALSMRHDPRKGASNQFTAKSWQSVKIHEGDKLTAIISDDTRTLVSLELKPKVTSKKKIYTGSHDTGDLFTWANLTPGYGLTHGFTAGAMFRRSRPTPAPDVQGELFEKATRIWH